MQTSGIPFQIYILIAPSGGGKSTFAKYFNQNCGIPILSSDSVRAEVTGDENDMSQDAKVWAIIHERAERMAREGSFIFDATNLTGQSRKFLLEIAARTGAQVKYIYLDVIIETAKRQNKQRTRQVPDWVIDKQFSKISLPHDNLLYVLGFDKNKLTIETSSGSMEDLQYTKI